MRSYRAILEKFAHETILARVALKDWQELDTLSLLSEKISGPILLGYVLWICTKLRNVESIHFIS